MSQKNIKLIRKYVRVKFKALNDAAFLNHMFNFSLKTFKRSSVKDKVNFMDEVRRVINESDQKIIAKSEETKETKKANETTVVKKKRGRPKKVV